MKTFDFGCGPVPAHRHSNGRGWVADTAYVKASAYVGGNARVFGLARVSESARIFGLAHVFGSACVDEYVYGIRRSDGHIFIYVRCADGQRRILAGCRYFTMPEARKHWKKTRDGTPLGQETMMILDLLELQLSTRKLGGKDASKDQ